MGKSAHEFFRGTDLIVVPLCMDVEALELKYFQCFCLFSILRVVTFEMAWSADKGEKLHGMIHGVGIGLVERWQIASLLPQAHEFELYNIWDDQCFLDVSMSCSQS